MSSNTYRPNLCSSLKAGAHISHP